jgi:hypothetical protein
MTNETAVEETLGKTENENINQDRQQGQPEELVSPKAGTATSSSRELDSLQLFNILQQMNSAAGIFGR